MNELLRFLRDYDYHMYWSDGCFHFEPRSGEGPTASLPDAGMTYDTDGVESRKLACETYLELCLDALRHEAVGTGTWRAAESNKQRLPATEVFYAAAMARSAEIKTQGGE